MVVITKDCISSNVNCMTSHRTIILIFLTTPKISALIIPQFTLNYRLLQNTRKFEKLPCLTSKPGFVSSKSCLASYSASTDIKLKNSAGRGTYVLIFFLSVHTGNPTKIENSLEETW